MQDQFTLIQSWLSCDSGSAPVSSDDFTDDSAEPSAELPTISMRLSSCADSRSPVANSTISSPSTCFGCCIRGASGDDRAESSGDCLPGLGVACCRPGGAGELMVLPFSVGAGEGGCVINGVVGACVFSGEGEPGGCVSKDDAGVSAGRGTPAVAVALACFRSFFFLRKHEPKDGMRGFLCFVFFLCSPPPLPKPPWFGMAYTKKDGSSSWPCCSWTPPTAGASRTLDSVRWWRCLPRLRLRPRPPGHRMLDSAGGRAARRRPAGRAGGAAAARTGAFFCLTNR